MKQTPLFAAHQKLGGKLIEFGGWEMPVQYTSITDEHLAVRTKGGVFDISHMGEVLVSGPGSQNFLNQTLTNDIRKVAVGQGQYTLMCNPKGGVIDDLYAYRLGPEEYLLIINASRIEQDVAWIAKTAESWSGDKVKVDDVSSTTGAIAVQGPAVAQFINSVFDGSSQGGTIVRQCSDLKKNQIAKFSLLNDELWIARTGYTGEDGFEVVAPAKRIESVWNRVLEKGRPLGLKPAGLGARDTLRTEMCYPLYGHELNETTTPTEAGLTRFVSLDKGEFWGRSVIAEEHARGVARRLVSFKMTGRTAPPRPDYPIRKPGEDGLKLGKVTSGTQSPSMGIGIGMGYVSSAFSEVGTLIDIEIRDKTAPAIIAAKPLYRKVQSAIVN